MYNPKIYFNVNVLKEVLEKYNWPSFYTLSETNSGNVIIRFSKCNILISEGFESSMVASFLNSDIGRNEMQSNLEIFHALDVIRPVVESRDGFIEPKGLVKYVDANPSLEKVKQGLNNICILLQTYLLSCIEGDFSWVEEYNKKYPDPIL
jgi:hypothetical protein